MVLNPNQFSGAVQLGFDPADDVDLGVLNNRIAASKAQTGTPPAKQRPDPSSPNIPQQLGMFYKAKDLVQMNPLEADRGEGYHDWAGGVDYPEGAAEDNDSLWERKLAESMDPYFRGRDGSESLYEEIQKPYPSGNHPGSFGVTARVERPVHVYHGYTWDPQADPDKSTIAQGHHRVAAAADIDPDAEIPVYHFDEHEGLHYAVHPQDHDPESMRKYGLEYRGGLYDYARAESSAWGANQLSSHFSQGLQRGRRGRDTA